jgi:hypothetical protein
MTTFRQLVDKCRGYNIWEIEIPTGGLDPLTGLAYSFAKWDEICSGKRPLREANDGCGLCWIEQSCFECPLSTTSVAGQSASTNQPRGCATGSHWNWITDHLRNDGNRTIGDKPEEFRKKCEEMRDAIRGLCPKDWDKELELI